MCSTMYVFFRPNPSDKCVPNEMVSSHTIYFLCYYTVLPKRSGALLHVPKILNKGIKGTSNLCWLNSVLQAILSTPLLPLLKSAVLWCFNRNAFTFDLLTAATCAKRHTSIQKCFIDIMDQLQQGSSCDPCNSSRLAVRLKLNK